MSSKNAIQSIARTSLDVSTLVGAYLPINPNGLTDACFGVRIVNDSDLDLDISFDGVTAHDYIGAGETIQVVIPPDTKSKVNFAIGSIVYVAGDGQQATGTVYLSGYYRQVV